MPQIFTEEEKQALKSQMLDEGFQLIKKYGMTHASVDRITKVVGIGRTTFYNFFISKEAFVSEIISHQREKGQALFVEKLGNRDKMTKEEAKEYFIYLLSGEDTIFRYLTSEDREKLARVMPQSERPDIQHETAVLDQFLMHIDGVKNSVDYEVVANLMKLIVIAPESAKYLHQNGVDRTLMALFDTLFSYMFEEP